MIKRQITVSGLTVTINKTNEADYVSLTDIAKQREGEAKDTIKYWMKNTSTIQFLWYWEEIHNPDFENENLNTFIGEVATGSFYMSPTNWVRRVGAKGIFTKKGRGGGTYAHKDIALNFCYWLDPRFQILMIKKFQELLEEDFQKRNLQWHLRKITDNIDEVRNLLDTIPHQDPDLNRIKGLE